MKTYLINNLKECKYDAVVTLLDYETQISTCLKSIQTSPGKTGTLLIDTALCSGMNEYRFIETFLDNNGRIDLKQYRYVNVSDDILKKSNDILKENPTFLKNSVLSKSEIEKLL